MMSAGKSRTAAVAAGTGLTRKEIKQCRKAFATFDKNGEPSNFGLRLRFNACKFKARTNALQSAKFERICCLLAKGAPELMQQVPGPSMRVNSRL